MLATCQAPAFSRRPRPFYRQAHACTPCLPQTRRVKCNVTSVPHAVSLAIKDSNKQWLKQALSSSHTLKDDETGSTVHLLGVCFFAPHQHRLVAAAIDELEPTHILLEQPPDQPAGVVLPHPLWIQGVLDHQEDVLAATSTLQSPSQPQHGTAGVPSAYSTGPGSLTLLQEQLSTVGHPEAKVGRDIIDPFESFGYYPGLDLFVNPQALAVAAELCGYMPGYELVIAAERASVEGVQLLRIDAPLKLQENWVKQLLENFKLDERQVISYKPIKDYQHNQQLMPAAAAEWDMQLAAAAQRLQLQAASAQQEASAQLAAGASSHESSGASAEQHSLLLYKISKATAAAMLFPNDTQAAVERLQRLQPLKWAHFRLRQRYMAQQIREVCAAAAGTSRKLAKMQQQQQQQQDRHGADASASGKPVRLLAVVGRQYVQGLLDIWRNPASSLWRDRVPRTFTQSMVERQEDAAATGSQQNGYERNPVSEPATSTP